MPNYAEDNEVLRLIESASGRDFSVDGSKLDSIISYSDYMPLIGFVAGDITTDSAKLDRNTYFGYVGRIWKAITTCVFRTRCTIAITGTIVWAEVGVFKGAFTVGAAPTLTRLGFTDVSSTFNSTGVKSTTISLSGVSVGDELWFAYGSDTSLLGDNLAIRAGLADNIESGVMARHVGQLSGIADATTVSTHFAEMFWAGLEV